MPTNIFKVIAVAYGGLACIGASRADDYDSAEQQYSCGDLVVAGGGTGGLYTAWRMIEAGLADPNNTCIFEQTQRVGEKEE